MKKEILEAIGLSEEQYSMAVFETAMEYLEAKAGTWASEIAQTRPFWLWWNHNWIHIDNVFYAEYKTARFHWDKEIALYIWEDDHKMDMIKRDIPKMAWEEARKFKESYSNMMHQVTKILANEKEVAI